MKHLNLAGYVWVSLAIMLTACVNSVIPADSPSTHSKERPLAYHDTRLQYALLTGDTETLANDFKMKLPPSIAERVVAGSVLPLTAAIDTLFWPVSTGIKTYAPSADYPNSAK